MTLDGCKWRITIKKTRFWPFNTGPLVVSHLPIGFPVNRFWASINGVVEGKIQESSLSIKSYRISMTYIYDYICRFSHDMKEYHTISSVVLKPSVFHISLDLHCCIFRWHLQLAFSVSVCPIMRDVNNKIWTLDSLDQPFCLDIRPVNLWGYLIRV